MNSALGDCWKKLLLRCREGWICLIQTTTKLMLPRWKRGTMTVERNMRIMPDYNCWWISHMVTVERSCCGRCREGWICYDLTATKFLFPSLKHGTMTVERNRRRLYRNWVIMSKTIFWTLLSCHTIGFLKFHAYWTPINIMEERTKAIQHVNEINY